jgi:hypothetical protein
MLDNKFCKDLFDDPYNTDVGFSPDGFTIGLTSLQVPSPHIVIGPTRAMFMSNDFGQVKSVIGKIKKELYRLKSHSLEISAIGVNTEYEFLEIEETAQKYLETRFLDSGFRNPEHFPVHMTDIRFQVKTDENNFYSLLIQPRANQPNGLYINVNAHRQLDISGIPSGEYLDDLYNQTNKELKDFIFPALDLEG